MLLNFVILLFYHSCDLDFRLVITLNYFKLLLNLLLNAQSYIHKICKDMVAKTLMTSFLFLFELQIMMWAYITLSDELVSIKNGN